MISALIPRGGGQLPPYIGSYVSQIDRRGYLPIPKELLRISLERLNVTFGSSPPSHSHDISMLAGHIPNWYLGGRGSVSLFSEVDLGECHLIERKEAPYFFSYSLDKNFALHLKKGPNIFTSSVIRFTGKGDFISLCQIACQKK